MESNGVYVPTQEEILKSNVVCHEALAHAHYLLTTESRFMHEQFEAVDKTVKILAALAKDLNEKINADVKEREKQVEPKDEAKDEAKDEPVAANPLDLVAAAFEGQN